MGYVRYKYQDDRLLVDVWDVYHALLSQTEQHADTAKLTKKDLFDFLKSSFLDMEHKALTDKTKKLGKRYE